MHPNSPLFFIPELFPDIGIKVFVALLCGGLIGLERELKSKPAGLKTNVLICVGACLYSVLGLLLLDQWKGPAGDPARIPAQIVSGIGFLGAGTIIQARGSIIGLTSAATIWVVAAIGMCIGLGYLVPALLFTGTVLFTLLFVNRIEKWVIRRSFQFEIVCDPSMPETINLIYDLVDSGDLGVLDFQVSERGEKTVVSIHYLNTKRRHKALFEELLALPGVGKILKIKKEIT